LKFENKKKKNIEIYFKENLLKTENKVKMLNVYNDCCCSGGGGGGVGPPGPMGPAGPGLVSETLQLPDNATTKIPITNCTNTGCYKILVASLAANGAIATFDCSKAQDTINGQTERVTNSPALTNERLKLDWTPGQKPVLYHTPTKTGGVGALLSYRVTMMIII
jgi:hypothetical protein